MADVAQVSLLTLLTDIEDATKSVERAVRESSIARSAECDAINTLNRLQKQFDKLVAETKAKAPRDSDWRQAQVQR